MHCTDYASARVCPSVRLSHTGILSKWLHISSTFFTVGLGSPTILIFSYQMGWQYSDGDPFNRVVKCKGGMNHDFRPISGFISELMQDRAIVTMENE